MSEGEPRRRRALGRSEERLQESGDHDGGDEGDQSGQEHEDGSRSAARGERLGVRPAHGERDEHGHERPDGRDVGDRDRRAADRDRPRAGAQIEDECRPCGQEQRERDGAPGEDRARDDRARGRIGRLREDEGCAGAEQPAEERCGEHDDDRLGERGEPRLQTGCPEGLEPARGGSGAGSQPRGREQHEGEQEHDRLSADEQQPPARNLRLRAGLGQSDRRRAQREVGRSRLKLSARSLDPRPEAVHVPGPDVLGPQRRDPAVGAVGSRRASGGATRDRPPRRAAGDRPARRCGRTTPLRPPAASRARSRSGPASRCSELRSQRRRSSPGRTWSASRPDDSSTTLSSPSTAPRRTISLPNRVSR